eukprot:TRINITY_DN213_c1_g2_i8.p2 TRINITY_DN213_c1_g2~~TRINITY_DN213_c1_g2_i8.p2  ORF type:complete len:119 (-),score=12.94 TRINITY_DN213_c1_g2_i8:92-448(-)
METVTDTAPAERAGAVQTMRVADTNVAEPDDTVLPNLHLMLPNPDLKFDPATVTGNPPVARPDVGESDETATVYRYRWNRNRFLCHYSLMLKHSCFQSNLVDRCMWNQSKFHVLNNRY